MFGPRDASVIGMPIPGFAGVDAVTSEQDWVVTGSHCGREFRIYVSPNVTREGAIRSAMSALNMGAGGMDWVSAARRDQVEQCVRLDGQSLRFGA